ncbi:MAG: SDR family NAD(P)-dependent oxidoreductase [Acidobacteria bacterium]|nr:SDR family NAD(P)-dependent oxidoreductase [Acidobacteriota bacterium]
MRDKVVVITGASSGIGAALAVEFASCGARVALLARRLDRLEALARKIGVSGNEVIALRCDVASDEEVKQALDDVRVRFGALDVLVANAGFGVSGKAEQLAVDDYRRQFATNVFGLLSPVLDSLPDLKMSRGRIVLLGSVSAYVSLPGHSAYSMSKFAVRALAEALWVELGESGISVTLVSPGFVESELRGEQDTVPSWLVMPARKAARKIVRAVALRRREVVITAHGRFVLFLERYFPALTRQLIRFTFRSLPRLLARRRKGYEAKV